MRVVLKASIPVECGNQAITDGSFAKLLTGFVERWNPEASYFFSEEGRRTCLFFLEMQDPSQLPLLTEPFFMGLKAQVTVTPAMDLRDVQSGIGRMLKSA